MTIEDIEKSKYWEDEEHTKSNMIFGEDDNFYSWLASRCVGLSSYIVEFRIFYVSGGTVDANDLYYSCNGNNSNSYAVRPVIEIDY